MDYKELLPANVLHWNYRGFTEFPITKLRGEETEITDIYLKENLISQIPPDIGKLKHLESLYLSGNDITELPREISKLHCLKCLDVSGNRLRRIPDEIGEVGGLKFLILDENELRELPLRMVELKSLRYLSVCDNQLQWLPQRPVYNYHHCEFRFWRNKTLQTIPYSMWYHMFRDQQTRSLNIGCLTYPKYQQESQKRCRLKMNRGSREWEFDVDCPQYNNLLETGICSPPSLTEICKRLFYQILLDAAKNLSKTTDYSSIYTNDYNSFENNNELTNLEDDFGDINIENNNGNITNYDMNGNNLTPSNRTIGNFNNNENKRRKSCYVPADVVNEHYSFLPRFIKQDLCNGPASRCENVCCKKPIFDYVIYEFCVGKIILIDNTEDVILSAAFCSKSCADLWKRGKSNLLSWSLKKDKLISSMPVSSKR